VSPETPVRAVEAGLNQIWQRTRPLLLARVATVERAILATATEAEIDSGRTESHRLAGVLGTFGLDRGTELARELERSLAEPDARKATRTRRLVTELRRTVERAHP
jgi:HPt (histidine-containing phosphotransfer) domain-containing protein